LLLSSYNSLKEKKNYFFSPLFNDEMMKRLFLNFLFFLNPLNFSFKIAKIQTSYEFQRAELFKKINHQRYGDMQITENDLKYLSSNPFSQQTTFKDLNDDFYSNSAMKYKTQIENHPFFAKLSELPKGALLHNHLKDSIDPEWFLKLLNNPNVYETKIEIRNNSYETLIYKKNASNLKSMMEKKAEYIKEHSSILGFDVEKGWELEIKRKISFFPDELEKIKNNNEAWAFFEPKIKYAENLITFKEFYFQHILNVFNQCIQDKLFRFETRVDLGGIMDENYTLISLDEEMNIYLKALKKIREKVPYFSFGIIVAIVRNLDDDSVKKKIREAFEMKKKYPELVLGFDFDGDENNYRSFHNLSQIIISTKQELEKEFQITLPLILHCGESVKFSNENPIDGILLEAKRLGHGLNLIKFPYLFDEIKDRNVCIEINPISNQILKNIIDLRWHPGITYLGLGIKIAISNDDPSIYNTKGVNYDLFVATAAFELNILDLKRIFLNSIECSMMNENEKDKMVLLFLKEWDEVILKWNNN